MCTTTYSSSVTRKVNALVNFEVRATSATGMESDVVSERAGTPPLKSTRACESFGALELNS